MRFRHSCCNDCGEHCRWAYVTHNVYVALEDSICAELVGEGGITACLRCPRHIDGVGDFLSNVVVGVLCSMARTTVAFGYTAALFLAGAVLELGFVLEGPVAVSRNVKFITKSALGCANRSDHASLNSGYFAPIDIAMRVPIQLPLPFEDGLGNSYEPAER